MALLIIGLVIFLGIHSVRIFAEDKRTALISERGENTYKLIYSLVSLAGLALIIVGYGQARLTSAHFWVPPVFLSHLAALLMLAAFVLLAAAYIPGNRIRAAVGHPMVLGVKVWAFAHLLSNGRVADVLLFGAFLIWAIVDYANSRKRDRLSGASVVVETRISRDLITVIVGVLAWLVFAMWAHRVLIGVSPFIAN